MHAWTDVVPSGDATVRVDAIAVAVSAAAAAEDGDDDGVSSSKRETMRFLRDPADDVDG